MPPTDQRITTAILPAARPRWQQICGAALYDCLLLFSLYFTVGGVYVLARGAAVPAGDVWLRTLLLLATYIYIAGSWMRSGQTLGMKSWRVRVITAAGSRPNLWQATLRLVLAIPSYGFLGLGVWWALVDHDGLSWHGRASGTRLVRS